MAAKIFKFPETKPKQQQVMAEEQIKQPTGVQNQGEVDEQQHQSFIKKLTVMILWLPILLLSLFKSGWMLVFTQILSVLISVCDTFAKVCDRVPIIGPFGATLLRKPSKWL